MKRRFKVTVDGETYTVEVEEIGGEVTPTVVERPLPQRRTTTRVTSARAPTADAEVVSAPLPGVITEVRVSVGEAVDEGSVLLVMEAMKMENEIYSPRKGTVSAVHVEAGQQVARGDALLVIS
jgi:biotin carboxyl carrier protein